MLQLSRLKEIETTLGHIWEEMRQGYIDDDWDLMQIAVYCQTDINRIVWKLNTIFFDPGDEEPPFQEVWIPITSRPGTDEEYADFCRCEYCPREEFRVFTSCMPEDGQEVLVTNKWGYVEADVFCRDGLNCYFDNNPDWDDVTAWMPKPKGYKKEVDNEDS